MPLLLMAKRCKDLGHYVNELISQRIPIVAPEGLKKFPNRDFNIYRNIRIWLIVLGLYSTHKETLRNTHKITAFQTKGTNHMYNHWNKLHVYE